MKKIFIFMLIFSLSGCASMKGYRKSAIFKKYFGSYRTITVMPPDVKIYKLTAGGVVELIDEWSDDAKTEVLSSIREEIGLLPSFKLSLIDTEKLSDEDKDFIKEQNGLYSAVGGSIILHTYIPNSKFKHKIDNFDYTLGSDISRLYDITGNDTLLFCTGKNYIWTGGRKALACFSLLLGVATGIYYIPGSGPNFIAVSLIDAKTGNIVWFNYTPVQGDLRKEEICRKNIEKLFSNFTDGDKQVEKN